MRRLASVLAATAVLVLVAPRASADPGTVRVGAADLTALVVEPPADPAAPPPMATPTDRAPRATTIFGLPKNVGPGDRVLRTVIGLGLAGAGIYGLSSGELSDTTSGILLGVSAVPFATAATGYCPLYQLVGIDRSF
jgi:Protein of unknown function (DUF2892)